MRDTELQKGILEALADPYMGRDKKRLRTYPWVPLHLADAAGKLAALEGVLRVEPLDGALRAYPKDKTNAGVLAAAVVALAGREGWRLDMVRTEEGQLDEVFRRITLPDTAKEGVR